MPTSWASALLASAVALALAGAAVWVVAVICGVAVLLEIVIDSAAIAVRDEQ